MHDRRRYEYFHMTKAENLESILQDGLDPDLCRMDIYLAASPEDCLQLVPAMNSLAAAGTLFRDQPLLKKVVDDNLPPVMCALLSVDMYGLENALKPQTNRNFTDHYFGKPFKYICEYRYLKPISPERIQLIDYYMLDIYGGKPCRTL